MIFSHQRSLHATECLLWQQTRSTMSWLSHQPNLKRDVTNQKFRMFWKQDKLQAPQCKALRLPHLKTCWYNEHYVQVNNFFCIDSINAAENKN